MTYDSGREGVMVKRSIESPLHPSTVGRKVDISHQLRDGSKLGSGTPKGLDTQKPIHDGGLSRGGDFARAAASPLHHETPLQKASFDSPHHSNNALSAGDTPRRVIRQGMRSGSIEHSPLHPQSQARIGGRGSGVSSPSWERKGSSEASHGVAPPTPGRSRLRSATRGDDTPDRSPAVPIFGDWDESDPSSAAGITQIFNKVREERQSGGGNVPTMPTETSYSNGLGRNGYDNSKACGCFPWSRR